MFDCSARRATNSAIGTGYQVDVCFNAVWGWREWEEISVKVARVVYHLQKLPGKFSCEVPLGKNVFNLKFHYRKPSFWSRREAVKGERLD